MTREMLFQHMLLWLQIQWQHVVHFLHTLSWHDWLLIANTFLLWRICIWVRASVLLWHDNIREVKESMEAVQQIERYLQDFHERDIAGPARREERLNQFRPEIRPWIEWAEDTADREFRKPEEQQRQDG
jgi:hypothetical protein